MNFRFRFRFRFGMAAHLAPFALLLTTSPAMAMIMADSRVEIVADSLKVTGSVTRSSNDALIFSSAFAQGTPWYGYSCMFSGLATCTATAGNGGYTNTVGYSYAQGFASYSPASPGGTESLTLRTAASNDGGPGNPSMGRGPAESEAWAMAFYEFKADATGQVMFSVDSLLSLNLGTSGVGEIATGWAFAGLEILPAIPTIDPNWVQKTPSAKFGETFVNGNFLFDTSYYDASLLGEVVDGANNNPTGPTIGHLTATANVVAGDTFYLAMSSYSGQRAVVSDVSAVPEPAGLWLMSGGLALMGFAGMRRQRVRNV